ncbi:phosphotransferase family protein [Sphingomonas bacterium]|uniref:phosphotransferase family protein n=1 Tax=Sphingomonas bacterium TaxID=1895847 RepID=UPI0015776F57|nr:aminoglycoside phosphotransferase family protein [Sphingomonas bacterium]
MGEVDAGDDRILLRQLWARVRRAFPDLAGSRFRLDQDGGDHLLLIVDERRAFRFPRPGRHGLDLEIAILRDLGRAGRIPVPDYDIVAPDGSFASYLLLPGVPLTPSRFAALSADRADDAIGDAVTLLTSLHAIDPRSIGPVEVWPRMWSPNQFADRLRRIRLPLLVERVPTLIASIEDFLRRYRDDRAPREVVVHGDLVGDHLLVDRHAGRLTGIIDFGDVALGDPAHDFLGFWEYGARAATRAAAAYGQADADPTLLARSRNHFVRYRIDRLFETIADDGCADTIHTQSAALAGLLAEPSTRVSPASSRAG